MSPPTAVRTCSLCSGRHYARGYCSRHYWRWRVHGDPHHEPRRAPRQTCETCGKSFYALPYAVARGYGRFCSRDCYQKHLGGPERLWEKVEKTPGCCLWTGGRLTTGYGEMSLNGRTVLVHRLAYELAHGPIPDNLCVLHRCDVRHCVNPDHLFLGTRQDNMADMAEKCRGPRGSRHRCAKLTEAQVRDIRRRWAESPRPTHRALAAEYGVNESTIRPLLARKTWRHVD